LLKQSNPELKYEVFTRLNRGGERLNAQEVRNVAYRGPLNDLVYELSESDFLHRQLKIQGSRSPSYRDMTDAEYVLRFFVMRTSWKTFSGSLSSSLDEFMREHRRLEGHRLQMLRIAFVTALETCEAIWAKNAFRRPVEKGAWRDQTLSGMYDAQMVAVSQLSSDQRHAAIARREQIVKETRDLFKNSVFEQSVRIATNTPSSVRYRIAAMVKVLLGAS